MSNPKELIELVRAQEPRFRALDLANGKILDFEQECLFARQQLLKNNFTLETAGRNPNSLQAAILNVSAIGISLNPALAHAYLVPRDGAICLDISFRGLVKIATDSGAIRWAKVELVYATDSFEWCGPASAPIHKANPFAPKEERGEMIGGYCIAKLPDGDIMTEVMSAEDIYKVRDTSKAWQKKGGPWKDWPDEMAKKTVMKRAAKSWPQTPNRQRLDTAVEALHEAEGTAYTIDEHIEFMRLLQSGDGIGLALFLASKSETVQSALHNSFTKGEMSSNKQRVRDLCAQGWSALNECATNLAACLDMGDDFGVREMFDDLPSEAITWLCDGLTGVRAHKLKEMGVAA